MSLIGRYYSLIVHLHIIRQFPLYWLYSWVNCFLCLTLSLPRMINFKFLLQPQRKYNMTAWRTWLFIAYSDERWLYYQFLLYLAHTFLYEKVGRMYVLNLGVSTSISHVWIGTTQAKAQAKAQASAPFSLACACVVPVHTWLMLALVLKLEVCLRRTCKRALTGTVFTISIAGWNQSGRSGIDQGPDQLRLHGPADHHQLERAEPVPHLGLVTVQSRARRVPGIHRAPNGCYQLSWNARACGAPLMRRTSRSGHALRDGKFRRRRTNRGVQGSTA